MDELKCILGWRQLDICCYVSYGRSEWSTKWFIYQRDIVVAWCMIRTNARFIIWKAHVPPIKVLLIMVTNRKPPNLSFVDIHVLCNTYLEILVYLPTDWTLEIFRLRILKIIGLVSKHPIKCELFWFSRLIALIQAEKLSN